MRALESAEKWGDAVAVVGAASTVERRRRHGGLFPQKDNIENLFFYPHCEYYGKREMRSSVNLSTMAFTHSQPQEHGEQQRLLGQQQTSERETRMSSSGNGSSDPNGSVVYLTGTPVVIVPTPTSTPAGTLPAKSVSADGTCGCNANGTPRTCYECLNVQLQSGEQCFGNPVGACMSATNADSNRPYFSSMNQATVTTNLSVIPHDNEFFGSANTTYCAASDSICLNCSMQWVNEYGTESLRSTYKLSCVGEGGCVCTAYCELRASSGITLPESYNVGSQPCSLFNLDWSTQYSATVTLARNIAVLLGGALVILISVRMGVGQFHQSRYNRRMRERRRALRDQRNGANLSGRMLTLEGWNGYREQLIDREQESLGLKTNRF